MPRVMLTAKPVYCGPTIASTPTSMTPTPTKVTVRPVASAREWGAFDLAIAANWYPTHYARVMGNIIRAKREDVSAMWIFQVSDAAGLLRLLSVSRPRW